MNPKEIDRAIESIRGSFAIEDMPMDVESEKACRDILAGEKTIDDAMKELIANYGEEK